MVPHNLKPFNFAAPLDAALLSGLTLAEGDGMKIERKALTHYLGIAKRIAPKAGPVPAFNDLRIEPQGLRVSSFEHTLELVVDTGIEAMVNLRQLDAAVKASGKSHDVQVEIAANGMLTVTGDIAIGVQLTDNEAERIEHIEYGELLKDWQYIDGMDKALAHHAQFVASDPSRCAFTGVYLDNIHVAATNGVFMCFNEIPNNLRVGKRGCIIPAKACKLAKYFEAYKADDLYFHQKIGGMVLSSRLADGTFPKFLDVLPETTEAYLLNGEISVITREYGDKNIAIGFGFCKISALKKDSDNEYTIPIFEQVCHCPKLGIFDQKLLIPCINAKGRNEIKFKASRSSNDAIVIDNANGTHVLMPMLSKGISG